MICGRGRRPDPRKTRIWFGNARHAEAADHGLQVATLRPECRHHEHAQGGGAFAAYVESRDAIVVALPR
jgi:hypothetical protein